MLKEKIAEHIETVQSLASMQDQIEKAGNLMIKAVGKGHTVFICGNGGSAADAQHFAAEIVGRFKKERRAWPAVALTTDTSILTAVGNDYGFDEIFSRQLEGLGKSGDILFGISTSGNSPNVLKAVHMACALKIKTIGLLGQDGGQLADAVDLPLIVNSNDTARIQESHIFLIHYLAECLETSLTPEGAS